MADFVKVAALTQVPNGSMKTFQVNGRSIALANMDGEVFAIADTCSHEQCSLGTEGYLDGGTVTCGCHGAQFDVTTGKVMGLPAVTDIPSYQTKVENGDIFVQI